MCVFLCACVAAGGSSKQWLIGKLEITELSSYQGLSAVLDLSLLICCSQAENENTNYTSKKLCFLLLYEASIVLNNTVYDLIIIGEKSNWYLFLCMYCVKIAWLSNTGVAPLDMQSLKWALLLYSLLTQLRIHQKITEWLLILFALTTLLWSQVRDLHGFGIFFL